MFVWQRELLELRALQAVLVLHDTCPQGVLVSFHPQKSWVRGMPGVECLCPVKVQCSCDLVLVTRSYLETGDPLQNARLAQLKFTRRTKY